MRPPSSHRPRYYGRIGTNSIVVRWLELQTDRLRDWMEYQIDNTLQPHYILIPPVPRLERAQHIRSALGIAIIALATLRWTPGGQLGNLIGAAIVSPMIKALVVLGSVIAMSILLVALGPAGQRTGIVRHLGGYVLRVLRLTVSFYLIVLFFPMLARQLFRGIFLAVRFSFNAVDAHPLLPSMVGISCGIFGIIDMADSVNTSVVPPTWYLLLNTIGAITTISLALYEQYYLRVNHGVTLRSGLQPAA